MIHTLEAIIDENGRVHLAEPVTLKGRHRALVTVLDEPPADTLETALLSEPALGEDWLRPEDDAAWAHLQ
jgi:hypothetical protein